MRTVYLLASTFVTALAIPQFSQAQESGNQQPFALNLACEGSGLRSDHVGYNAHLYVHINEGGAEIQIPRQMVGGFNPVATWVPLRDVKVDRSEISAGYRLGLWGSTRVRIDRVHGEIRVSGPGGTFDGDCSPYDPSAVENAF
ncbi:hypothetical protein [Luteimonas terrae]|uniref:Adhesin n=1 Tax=Luteimonas terrae TaxID=1530191 RepID=A0ABU1XX17_9GAMM|nr:hypothetical protein [Luteimonas terrae]MDR7193253.1 hypothetical protein [Luteimonas terrae]